MKVLYVCNKGGHYSQMLSLKDLMSKDNSVVISDKKGADADFGDCAECYYMPAFNYKKHKIWYLIKNFFQALAIILKFKPDYIVTTGAGIAVPVFVAGKLTFKRLIYIETRARVYSKSSTGRMLSKIADKVIVQWPEMVDVYGGKAEYFGTII